MRTKAVRYAVTFAICVAVGVGIAAQAGITDGQMLYVSSKTVSEYETQIESEREAIEKLQMQLAENDLLLLDYMEKAEDDQTDYVAEKLQTELNSYLIMTGMAELRGEGVKIVVDDGTRALFEGEDINNVLVHDADILMIINELKKCKAEAIAVNGHRITPRTSISCSGYTIRMDGQVYARPFTITAIGDSKRISNLLLSPDGYGTSLKNWGVQFSLEVVEDMRIAADESGTSFKFAKAVESPEMFTEKMNTDKELEGQ